MATIMYDGKQIAGGGVSIVHMTEQQYLQNKTALDASDLLIEITDKDYPVEAGNIGFTPPSGMSATNVQGAIEEVNGKTFSQKAGESIQINIPSVVGIAHAANLLLVNIPLPFYANNTSYTVTINSAAVDGIGAVTATPFSKQRSCVVLELSASGIAYNNVRECIVDITITFA